MEKEDKFDKQIMVVKKEIVFENNYFQGFRAAGEVDYEQRIIQNFKYMRRGDVEQDPNLKQPIAYCAIVNPSLKKVFVYQRSSKDHEYTEKRLQGKYSCGIGGHIEKIDINNNENPIYSSLKREALKEEVKFVGYKGDPVKNIKILGYINYDGDDVGKVHFGMLYLIETDSLKVKPLDSEVAHGEFKTINELEKICSSPDLVVEDWTKIALEPLKEYFASLS